MELENRVASVVVFRPLLAERVATTIKKGAHVLVEGSLSARPTNNRMAKARRRRLRRLRRGQSAPMSCAGTGVQRSCALMSSTRRPSDDVRGPFFVLEI